MFSLYKKELQSYYYSPFAYVIAALFLLVFSITFVVGISDLSGTQYNFHSLTFSIIISFILYS